MNRMNPASQQRGDAEYLDLRNLFGRLGQRHRIGDDDFLDASIPPLVAPPFDTIVPALIQLFTVGVSAAAGAMVAVALVSPTLIPNPMAMVSRVAVAFAVPAWVAMTDIAPPACTFRVSPGPV